MAFPNSQEGLYFFMEIWTFQLRNVATKLYKCVFAKLTPQPTNAATEEGDTSEGKCRSPLLGKGHLQYVT